MNAVNFEIVIILLLILANGVLAMSELAVVSARPAHLEQRAAEGDTRARMALTLARDPGIFLSTVQIGITLLGILIGVFSGATISQALAAYLAQLPGLAPYSQVFAIGVVVVITTYLALVVGELVPKRLALRFAAPIAMMMARPLHLLSRITYPFVRLLDLSTRALLRLLGVKADDAPSVSEDEVRFMLRQGTELGIFEPMEHDMLGRVFRLADQRVGALLTPRPEIVWLEIDAPQDELRRRVAESGRSRFPVARGDLDEVLGVVLAKDMLAQSEGNQPIDLHAILRPAVFVPETAPALTVIEKMKAAQSKIAMVIDEYGGLAGLVTVDDIMEAIVGDIGEEDEVSEPLAIQRADGSWLIDGMMTLDEFFELFEIKQEEKDARFVTVGGLVMAILAEIPKTGDTLTWMGLTLEVVDMDGHRVDKVLVRSEETEEKDAARQEEPIDE